MMRRILLIVALVSIAGIASFYGGMWYTNHTTQDQVAKHNLLAKRIFISQPSDTILNFEPLRNELRDDLQYYKGDISLYFEYLPTGTSIKIGDTVQLVGASLLKVPVAMVAYRLSEEHKLDLNAKVKLKQEWLDDGYGELYKKGVGYELSIHELMKFMLEDSDNTALNALQSLVDQAQKSSEKLNAYDALDIEFTDDKNTQLALSARSYSSFLKCLYFSCYVSPDSSQAIMDHLTHSTNGVAQRMNKYIPKDVKVAHKIGVAGDQTQADCGVVYLSDRNYILCIMVNDTKLKGSEVIAQTSKKVFDYVKNR